MAAEYMVTKEPRMSPVHPGEILREEVLPALKLSVSEAARQLGVSRQTLHRIMAGTHSITPEMAVRIGKFCGNGPGRGCEFSSAMIYGMSSSDCGMKSIRFQPMPRRGKGGTAPDYFIDTALRRI